MADGRNDAIFSISKSLEVDRGSFNLLNV